MYKDYTYTRAIGFDFDEIAREYGLDKSSGLGRCIVTINDFIKRFDDEDYYLIDNVDEIAQDLYDYIQSK